MKTSHMRASALIPVLALALGGCLAGPGFFRQDGKATLTSATGGGPRVKAAVESDDGAVVTAGVAAGANATQVVEASAGSDIAGTELLFPPGAVAVDTAITLEQGAALATDDTASELGIATGGGSTLAPASNAVVISSSAAIDATQPFTVNLVIDGAALALQDALDRLVVIYKVRKVDAGGGTFVGVIPRSELMIVDGKVSFRTVYFGAYQAAYAAVEITAPQEVATQKPIATVRNPPPPPPPPQPEPGKDLPEVRSLQAASVAADGFTLRWQGGGGATVGYRVSHVVNAANDPVAVALDRGAPAPGCKDAGAAEVKDAAAGLFRLTGLPAFTNIVVRVCAVDGAGNASPGVTLVQRTDDLPAADPTAPQLVRSNSRRLDLQWTPPGPGGVYVVAWSAGTPGAPNGTVTRPPNCNVLAVNKSDAYGSGTSLPRFTADTPVAFRICARNRSGQLSPGIGFGPVRTKPLLPSIVCSNGGSLDSNCQVDGLIINLGIGEEVSGAGNLVLFNGAEIRAWGGAPLVIDLGGNLSVLDDVGGTSKLVADGKGLAGGTPGNHGGGITGPGGPGAGRSTAAQGGGGAHGGNGGFAPAAFNAGPNGQGVGDYARPRHLGPGGGGAGAEPGGTGGGAVYIVADSMLLNGLITASGMPGADGSGGTGGGGGGAGGSILIETRALSGSGSLVARGGAGGNADVSEGAGGGGGGGRIAMYYNGPQSVIGSLSFDADGGAGGAGGVCGGSGFCDGAAGTIYKHDTNGTVGALSVMPVARLNDNLHARTLIPDQVPATPAVSLKVGAKAVVTVVSHLPPAAPAANTPAYRQLALASLHVLDGGVIDNSGHGDPGGAGSSANAPGARGGLGAGASQGGGGGGNGGSGGNGDGLAGSGGAAVGGAVTDPVTLGGGGGSGSSGSARGGHGGGALKLVVTGTATIDGEIRVDGRPGQGPGGSCGGGGAGGSLWLRAAVIAETLGYNRVAFLARGGDGYGGCASSGKGGGGGGGRIYLDSPVVDPELECLADGGGGFTAGGGGTAFLRGGVTACPAGAA